jgi:hypothetical protein
MHGDAPLGAVGICVFSEWIFSFVPKKPYTYVVKKLRAIFKKTLTSSKFQF